MYTTDLLSSTIVVVGSFNPRIFSPDWLEKNELIGPNDAEYARNASDLIITAQITRVQTEWFVLQVVEEQLILEGKGVLTPNLKDLAVGIFSILGHIPVTAVGLNFLAHFKIQSHDFYHFFGDQLAPKEIWYGVFPRDDYHAGLDSLVIKVEPATAMKEAPKIRDAKNITVSHSKRFTQAIQFVFNNHFDISGRGSELGTSADATAKIVEESWQLTWDESVRTFKAVLDSTLERFNNQQPAGS